MSTHTALFEVEKMSITPTSYCHRCQFYHGDNQVNCGPNPYGVDSETCSDYVPKASSLSEGQITKDRWSSQLYFDWEVGRQFLVMLLGMLIGVLGSGCLAVCLTTHSTAPTTKTVSQSEWVR